MAETDQRHVKRHDCPLPPTQDGEARSIVAFIKIIWRGINRANSFGLAAQMAFWLFLSLLPLAAVAGLLLARIAVERSDLTATMLDSTPPAVRELISTQLAQVAKWNGGAVAPLAAVVFVWLASSGIHGVFDALELQRGVERPWWKKRLIALAACVVLSLGIVVLALLATGAGWLFRVAGSELPRALTFWRGSWFVAIARVLSGGVIGVGLLAGLYAAGTPRVRQGRHAIVPGAVLAVSLQAVSGLGYGLYVHLMGTGNAYQAGLGIVGVTMMSLYLLCLALLVGAELNQAISDRRHASDTKPLLVAHHGQPSDKGGVVSESRTA